MSEQEQTTAVFESWALVELMGRQRIVGKAKEETHFGAPLLRIDVPATEDADAYTKFFGGGAIYCITPVSEAVALRLLANIRTEPVPAWDLRTPAETPALTLGLGGGDIDEDVFEDEDEPDDSDEL